MKNVEAAGGSGRIPEILPSTLIKSNLCSESLFQRTVTVIGETV